MVVDFMTSPQREWVAEDEIANRLCMDRRQVSVVLKALRKLRFVMHESAVINGKREKGVTVQAQVWQRRHGGSAGRHTNDGLYQW